MFVLLILPEPGFLAFTTFSGPSSANAGNSDVKSHSFWSAGSLLPGTGSMSVEAPGPIVAFCQ